MPRLGSLHARGGPRGESDRLREGAGEKQVEGAEERFKRAVFLVVDPCRGSRAALPPKSVRLQSRQLLNPPLHPLPLLSSL